MNIHDEDLPTNPILIHQLSHLRDTFEAMWDSLDYFYK